LSVLKLKKENPINIKKELAFLRKRVAELEKKVPTNEKESSNQSTKSKGKENGDLLH